MYVTFCWYCHASWVTGDEVLADLSRQNLRSILLAHTKLSAPVSLAITGSFLSRLQRVDAETFEILKESVRSNVVEVVGTFFHEIFVPTTDISYLERHIQKDLELKERIFGKEIKSFFPANFNWSPALQILLEEFGFEDVVLDETHLRLMFADVDFKWTPEKKKPNPAAIPSLADFHDVLTTFRIRNSCSQMNFHFRSIDALLSTTYGNSGGIHKTLSDKPFKGFDNFFSGLGGACLIADDFDRVNMASLPNYIRFLERIGSDDLVALSGRAEKTAFYDIDFVPGHTTAGLFDFWLDDSSSFHWVRTLDEVLRVTDADSIDEQIMQLQDCFPVFYSKHLDCLKFWKLAREIQKRDFFSNASGLVGR